MRTILVLLFFLIFFIISIPLLIIEFIIGKFNPNLKLQSSQKLVRIASNIILYLSGVKLTSIGMENVPHDKGVLYVFNHRSYFDILACYATVPNLAGFIAKKEMKKVPFINLWMKNINCLFLDRENIREGLKVILKGIELVKSGHSMFIAPEGTRNKEKEMLPFKEGSLKIAEKTACPIIPVSINNADSIFEKHVPWIKKTHVIIEYGKPIYPKELDKEKQKFLGQHVQSIIKETLAKNEASLEF